MGAAVGDSWDGVFLRLNKKGFIEGHSDPSRQKLQAKEGISHQLK